MGASVAGAVVSAGALEQPASIATVSASSSAQTVSFFMIVQSPRPRGRYAPSLCLHRSAPVAVPFPVAMEGKVSIVYFVLLVFLRLEGAGHFVGLLPVANPVGQL